MSVVTDLQTGHGLDLFYCLKITGLPYYIFAVTDPTDAVRFGGAALALPAGYTAVGGMDLPDESIEQSLTDIIGGIASAEEIKLKLIDFISLQNQDLQVPFFLGREVIVDDGIPVVGTGEYQREQIFLFGRGAFGLGNATIPLEEAFETDRDSLAGDDILISRRHFILHPRGVAFTGTYTGQTPSETDLATPANWEKVYTDKNVRIVRLLVNV